MKTYVLILSKTFPKGHPREGEETKFADALRWTVYCRGEAYSAQKFIEILPDYDLWKKRIDEVLKGEAVLSVREWTGRPFRSKQEEVYCFNKDSYIVIEKLDSLVPCRTCNLTQPCQNLYNEDVGIYTVEDGKANILENDLATDYCLSLSDFREWFSDRRYDRTKPMAIIHFTKFRYCK